MSISHEDLDDTAFLTWTRRHGLGSRISYDMSYDLGGT